MNFRVVSILAILFAVQVSGDGLLSAAPISQGVAAAETAPVQKRPPLPARARLVTEKEWISLAKNPGFKVVDQQTRNAQKLAAQTLVAEDETEIRKAEKVTGVKIRPDDVLPDENSRALADGNWIRTVMIKGEKRQFVLMGNRWSKHAVASTLRTAGKRPNQIQFYEKIYKGLDPATIKQLALIDPDLIKKTPGKYSDADVSGLNLKLAKNAREIVGRLNGPLAQLATPTCANDVGRGVKGDESGNKASCRFSNDGIYANFVFGMQPNLTCVKDQGYRGSCTSFSTTANIEYQVRKQTGQFVNLSEQALYNQTKLNWFREDFQEGDWVSRIADKLQSTQWRLPFESQWDYNPSHTRHATLADGSYTQVASYQNSCDNYDETCSDTTHQGQMHCSDEAGVPKCGFSTPDINPGATGYAITGQSQVWDPYDRDTSMSLLMLSVALKNPIIWGFEVNYGWDTINSAGFVQYFRNQRSRGGHSALIVGYINNATLARILPHAPQASGEGYFIVKNSWSNCFGDGGFAYVPYDYVKSYTNEAIVLQGVR